MVILDTNHISILERRGPDASSLLIRLADIPVTDACPAGRWVDTVE